MSMSVLLLGGLLAIVLVAVVLVVIMKGRDQR